MVGMKRALNIAGALKAAVYLDQNGNGQLDCGERGIAGIGIDVVNCNDQENIMHAQYSTDPSGLMEIQYDLEAEAGRWRLILPNIYEVTHISNPLQEDVPFEVNPVVQMGFSYIDSDGCDIIAGDDVNYELSIGLKLTNPPTRDTCDQDSIRGSDHAVRDKTMAEKGKKSKKKKNSSKAKDSSDSADSHLLQAHLMGTTDVTQQAEHTTELEETRSMNGTRALLLRKR